MGKPAPVRHPEAMRRSLAVAAALVALAGEYVAIAVSSAGEHRWNEAAVGAVVLAYAAVGLLIVWHRPTNPVGLIALSRRHLGAGPGTHRSRRRDGLRDDPADRTAALASVVGSTLGALPWLVLVLWLPLVFPDGSRPENKAASHRPPHRCHDPRRLPAVSLLSPNLTRIEFNGIDSPIGLPHAFEDVIGGLAGLGLLLGLASLGLAVACLVQQYRRGGPLGRQQTLIFGLAFVPPVVAFAASIGDSAGPWVFGISTLPFPVAIGSAVLQRRLYDLPLVVNRRRPTDCSGWRSRRCTP